MPKKILIVDDDNELVAMMKLVLEQNGYEVRTAANATEADQALEQGFHPDGMILDVMMEGKGEGIIFARKLRKHPARKGIPILMLTCMSEATGFRHIKTDPRDPVFLPVDIYLEKPVPPEKLIKQVEKLLTVNPLSPEI